MPLTTYTEFVANVSGVVITGVTRQYSEPPLSLNTADLPASWPMLPTGQESQLVFCTNGGNPEMSCALIVAYEAVGQSRQIENYSGTLTLMDDIQTALRDTTKFANKGGDNWQTAVQIVQVAGIDYWAVVTSITAFG